MTKIPQFFSTLPKEYPLQHHVCGEANKFIEELNTNVYGEQMFNALGINPNKTYVLTGPPGTGKTMAVKAFNNTNNIYAMSQLEDIIKATPKDSSPQVDLNTFNTLLFEYDIGKHGTAYINMSSRTVQSFFDTVFTYASHGMKSLISIDEADALIGTRKSSMQRHSEDRKVLETIMKNMQVAHDTPNVYVAIMTNTPEDCDDAALRAGRIDKKIEFKLPNYEERKVAYTQAINQINDAAGYKVIRSYNENNLAEISNGFNYADIFQSVEKSVRSKAVEMIKSKEPGIIRAGYIRGNRLEQEVNAHAKEFQKSKSRKIGFV